MYQRWYYFLQFQASEYARERGIPRLFLTANSGARIGMALSLKNKFKVCFVDETDPSKGFKYIYMDQRESPVPVFTWEHYNFTSVIT